MWSFDLPVLAYCGVALALVATFVLLGFFLPMMRRVVTLANNQTHCPLLDSDDYPPVTVLVYAHNDAWNLPNLIHDIFNQDYPAQIEVVVVDDIAVDNTRDVVLELQATYPSLYLTFMPERSRNLSRKKLAVTIGLKAASYDVVTLTCGNCTIPSPDWLRRMMRHVVEGKDVVIGYATLRDNEGNPTGGMNASLRSFDCAWDALRYLSCAIAGNPTRGNGNNLIYRKELFFKNKGFARSLNLNFGDDDILISEIANGSNAAVEISEESIIDAREWRPGVVYELDKLHHDFTARFLPKRPRLAMGLYCTMAWAWLFGSVAAVLFGWPSLIPAIFVLLLTFALWLPLMFAWRNLATALMSPRIAFLTVPFLILWHPLFNLRYRIAGARQKRENFTWSKLG